jgi:hypothetical protein
MPLVELGNAAIVESPLEIISTLRPVVKGGSNEGNMFAVLLGTY